MIHIPIERKIAALDLRLRFGSVYLEFPTIPSIRPITGRRNAHIIAAVAVPEDSFFWGCWY